jgi:hypothetical protein
VRPVALIHLFPTPLHSDGFRTVGITAADPAERKNASSHFFSLSVRGPKKKKRSRC